MQTRTTSSPILLIPSWGATLPIMTISLLAGDHYTVSLWMKPHGETCEDSFRKGSLRLMKWGWYWIESSQWLHWKYAFPGSYCITTEPFSCANCTRQVWGHFEVPNDTSMGALCCFDKMIALKKTSVEPHRYDPMRKTVRLRLELDVKNSCGTRFHVALLDSGSETCGPSIISNAPSLGDDELLPWKDTAFHNIPLNTSRICAQLTPRCDDCAFMCASSFLQLELDDAHLRTEDTLNKARGISFLHLLWFWLGTSAFTSFLIFRLTNRALAPSDRIPLIPGQYAVIDVD